MSLNAPTVLSGVQCRGVAPLPITTSHKLILKHHTEATFHSILSNQLRWTKYKFENDHKKFWVVFHPAQNFIYHRVWGNKWLPEISMPIWSSMSCAQIRPCIFPEWIWLQGNETVRWLCRNPLPLLYGLSVIPQLFSFTGKCLRGGNRSIMVSQEKNKQTDFCIGCRKAEHLGLSFITCELLIHFFVLFVLFLIET